MTYRDFAEPYMPGPKKKRFRKPYGVRITYKASRFLGLFLPTWDQWYKSLTARAAAFEAWEKKMTYEKYIAKVERIER